MKRYRMNQILSVLLFPFLDSDWFKEDLLYKRHCKYEEYLKYNKAGIGQWELRKKCENEYQGYNKEFADYIMRKNKWKNKSYDDVVQLCRLYYSTQDIKATIEEIEKWRSQKGLPGSDREIISDYYIEYLKKIAMSLLTYRDGVAAIRPWARCENENDIFEKLGIFDKVEIWNLLIRFTVPDIYVAILAAENGLGEEAFYGQKAYVSLADKLLVKSLKNGLAENHIHFNAGYDYESLWILNMNIFIWLEKEECHGEEGKWLTAAFFRLAAALFLRDGYEGSFGEWVISLESKEPARLINSLHKSEWVNAFDVREIDRFVKKYIGEEVEEAGDYLLETLYAHLAELRTSSEILFLYYAYRYIRGHREDCHFAHLFLQYLRLKNDYFSDMQQKYEVQGLRFFQNFYNRSKSNMVRLASNKNIYFLQAFRTQMQIPYLKKIEIRVAPEVDFREINGFDYEGCEKIIKQQLAEQLFEIFYAYRQYILESIYGVGYTCHLLEREKEQRTSFISLCEKVLTQDEGKRNMEGEVPTVGIVYHFLKREYMDNVTGVFCWLNIQEDMVKYSNHKAYVRQCMKDTAIAIEELRSTIPFLGEYIVGIDVASEENAMEPWMFVPVYRSIRSEAYVKPVLAEKGGQYQYIQNIGFPYHVGEEFRHIVSGLRHMDEVIEKFRYKAGDRLGHAIALGIDVEKWVKDNEVVAMPIQEHLENLLWIWGKNAVDGLGLPIQLEVLEEKILTLIHQHKLYEKEEQITVRMLYQAYQEKLEPDHHKIMQALCEEKEVKSQPASYCCWKEEDCKVYALPWDKKKLLCTNYCPVFEEKYRKTELIAVSESDIGTYKILQEHLLTKVAQMGIYVETNPTSNLTIGDMNSWQEQPIFKMNTLEEKMENRVMVTVNSDDPIVFNTNVENEFAYIYYAMGKMGYPKETILEWIERVRKCGMEASFIQKVKSKQQLLREISLMMDEIKRYL